MTKFSLATKESWKDKEGNWQEQTQWCAVVGYGEGFAKLADRLLKGKHVLVQGRLHTNTYQGKSDAKHQGKKITVEVEKLNVECIADTVRFLDRNAKDKGEDDNPQEAPE